MGAFQTLREQGLLPLVQVDEHGTMRCVRAVRAAWAGEQGAGRCRGRWERGAVPHAGSAAACCVRCPPQRLLGPPLLPAAGR